MTTLTVHPEKVAEFYRVLDTIGCLGDPRKDGFLRSSWSKEETQAMQVIRDAAEKLGLKGRFDAIGNFTLELAGTTPQFVETGSHLDTVVRGGNYDGAAGVVSGICAIQQILSSGRPLRKGLRLRIWRGEEGGTYVAACKGSRAAFGLLPPKDLERKFRDRSLRDAIREAGFDPLPIEKSSSTILQSELDTIDSHIELHIEQANALEQQKLDIGVVTSIRGPIRWRVSLEGSFDHSGGTPMGKKFRRDANLAFCHIGVELDRLCTEAIAQGNDLVQTIGVVNSEPDINKSEGRVYQNAIAKVSGFLYFTIDIRSSETGFRKKYAEQALALVRKISEEFRVVPNFELLSDSQPLEALSPSIQDALSSAADALGLKSVRMPSGAIHDCLYLGQQKRSSGEEIPVGMIFIPCRNGISHSPEEFSTYEEIANGASVLANAMLSLAS